MISMIFRFLGLFFVAWVFQRGLNYFLGASKRNRAKNNPAGPSNQMVKDPVCGMYMDSRLAVRLNRKSEDFFFCSEECKQKYLNGSSGTGVAGPSAPP
jgi:uncharacterized protein